MVLGLVLRALHLQVLYSLRHTSRPVKLPFYFMKKRKISVWMGQREFTT
jgi:hypothetical protein